MLILEHLCYSSCYQTIFQLEPDLVASLATKVRSLTLSGVQVQYTLIATQVDCHPLCGLERGLLQIRLLQLLLHAHDYLPFLTRIVIFSRLTILMLYNTSYLHFFPALDVGFTKRDFIRLPWLGWFYWYLFVSNKMKKLCLAQPLQNYYKECMSIQ